MEGRRNMQRGLVCVTLAHSVHRSSCVSFVLALPVNTTTLNRTLGAAGNHAQGVALSGSRLGIPCTIVMPKATPSIKVRNVSRLGAKVITLSKPTASEIVKAGTQRPDVVISAATTDSDKHFAPKCCPMSSSIGFTTGPRLSRALEEYGSGQNTVQPLSHH